MITKLIILVAFAFAFMAGLMVGLSNSRRAPGSQSVAQYPTTGPTTRPLRHRGGGFLTAELGLSTEQQSQLDQIWSSTVRSGMRESDDQRRQFRRERDEAIAALIHPEDRGAYDQILDTYSKHIDALDAQRRLAFQSAVEHTKKILTPEQRTKYDALLARMESDHSRRPGDRATTRERSDR